MIDGQGRVIDYMRISVTDRCNLRCRYCMPESGVELFAHREILSYEEIERICRVMAADGLKKIKLTGGEPLLRRNLAGLTASLKKIPGIEEVTLTTNGVLLKQQLPALLDAGLDAVNISLDTLDPVRYEQITRGGRLETVLESLEAASACEKIKVKINCVSMNAEPGEAVRMAALARERDISVRFIELMPLGQGKLYQTKGQDTIQEELESSFGPAIEVTEILGNGPAVYVAFEGFRGKIGFISALSHRFCERCNRVRLTSDGYLKACLQYPSGADLKELIRGGCSDDALRERIGQVLLAKPAGHRFLEDNEERKERLMSQIGG